MILRKGIHTESGKNLDTTSRPSMMRECRTFHPEEKKKSTPGSEGVTLDREANDVTAQSAGQRKGCDLNISSTGGRGLQGGEKISVSSTRSKKRREGRAKLFPLQSQGHDNNKTKDSSGRNEPCYKEGPPPGGGAYRKRSTRGECKSDETVVDNSTNGKILKEAYKKQ